MTHPTSEHVTLVEILALKQPFDQVAPVIERAVKRLEREGVRSLLSMQFSTDAQQRELAVVITFSSPAEMMAHTRMISGWDEFKEFASAIQVVDMRVHGKLNPEVEAWIAQFNGPLRKFERHVVGFVRYGSQASSR